MFELVIIATETGRNGKSKMLPLSLEHDVRVNLPIGTPVSVTIVL